MNLHQPEKATPKKTTEQIEQTVTNQEVTIQKTTQKATQKATEQTHKAPNVNATRVKGAKRSNRRNRRRGFKPRRRGRPRRTVSGGSW